MLRLKELRKEMGLTQQELADGCKLGRRTISDYERGITMPGAVELNQLSAFFNVTVDYLLGLSNQRSQSSTTSTNDVTLAFYNQHGIVTEEQKKEVEAFIEFVKSKK